MSNTQKLYRIIDAADDLATLGKIFNETDRIWLRSAQALIKRKLAKLNPETLAWAAEIAENVELVDSDGEASLQPLISALCGATDDANLIAFLN